MPPLNERVGNTSPCINSLKNVLSGWKTYQCLQEKHVDLTISQNFVKMQQYRYMEYIWTFHQQNVVRFVGLQAAQGQPGWAMLMRGRSLLGHSSRYLAMMTWPVLTKLFKAWSMIVLLILVYDILIPSQSQRSSAPNRHALNYWLAYRMTDTYLLMVL